MAKASATRAAAAARRCWTFMRRGATRAPSRMRRYASMVVRERCAPSAYALHERRYERRWRAADPRGHGGSPARSTCAACWRWPRPRSATISSERLAELAGVNAAKVRKDLSYLGSLRHPRRGLRRRVPALPDQPRAGPHPGLAGRHRRRRQPGPRAGQLPGVRRARASAIVALFDADPAKVGEQSAAWGCATSTTCPTSSGRAGHRHRHHRHARRRGPGRGRPAGGGGRTSILNFAPDRAERSRPTCRCARSTCRSSCRS